MGSKMRDPTGGASKTSSTARSTSVFPRAGPPTVKHVPMAGWIRQMRGDLPSLDIGSNTFWTIELLAEVRWLLAFG